MGETANIAEVAKKITKDIFRHFKWHKHPLEDENFSCTNEEHKTDSGKQKANHPTDVVLSYQDPYLGTRVHMLFDLKSYASDSISNSKLRLALKSLALSTQCANESQEWRLKFGVITSEPHEVRGLLFVHNHDNGYQHCFYDQLKKVNTRTLPIARGNVLHYLGPNDIQRLYSIGNDLIRLRSDHELPEDYTFYYPDLVLRRRNGEVWDQAATIESMAGPFMIIKHKPTDKVRSGYVIYYNKAGDCPEEFEYLIDCFSRFQMLESEELIRIRVACENANSSLKSHFNIAAKKYAKVWGFDETRSEILEAIEVERITAVTSNYNPGDLGWRA